MGWDRVPYEGDRRKQEYPRFGTQVLEKGLEMRDEPSGVDWDLPEGLGDVFRPGFWLSVPLQPV